MPRGGDVSQLSLLAPACKEPGCDEPIVGSSVKGAGHVCKRHNALEWADGLARSQWEDHRRLAALIRTEAAKPADPRKPVGDSMCAESSSSASAS